MPEDILTLLLWLLATPFLRLDFDLQEFLFFLFFESGLLVAFVEGFLPGFGRGGKTQFFEVLIQNALLGFSDFFTLVMGVEAF